jgi:hypothetical protein
MPLLLFTASVLHPAAFGRAEAERLLMEKGRDVRLTEWPGPIAGFVLMLISEGRLRQECISEDETETRDRNWLADFYRGVLDRGEGRISDFKQAMRKLADTSRPEWSDDDFFLGRMWGEEFFLARYEVDLNSNGV